jgi:YebC/PmpR family DNA-binding regulatory protein
MGRKWQNIKYKKAADDSRRGKTYTKHAKLIAVAARGGGDPASNSLLKIAIDNAKAANVPNDNIEKAIKKGTGEDKNAAVFEEIVYEGFGPGGVAMLIEVFTDNRNRAMGNLRTTMGKRGGRMAESGAVAWMFKKVGEIILSVPSTAGESEAAIEAKAEELELLAIDLGAEDVQVSHIDGETLVKIVCSPENLGRMRRELEAKGLKIEESKMTYDASTKVALVEGSAELAELERLVGLIEEDDDVSEVYMNLE